MQPSRLPWESIGPFWKAGGLTLLRISQDRWLLPCVGLVAVQWAVIGLLALVSGFKRPAPLLESLVIGFSLFGVACAALVLSSDARNLKRGYKLARYRIPTVGIGLLTLVYQMALLSWAKTLMPHFSGGFWADPLLADLDFSAFGVEPWVALQRLPIGQILQAAYGFWIPITSYAIVAVLITKPSAQRDRALVSFFALWTFGALFQFFLPSAGPMFYQLAGWGDRFADLPAHAPLITHLAQEGLWQFHQTGAVKAGIGISAMPSMHVAEAAWLVIVCRQIWPMLTIPAAAFFVAISLGSVFLGFHYVSDGVVGTLAAVLIWYLLKWLKFP